MSMLLSCSPYSMVPKEQVKRCSSIVMRFTCMPVTDLLTVYAHQNEKSWHLSCIGRCIVMRVHTTPLVGACRRRGVMFARNCARRSVALFLPHLTLTFQRC